MSTSNVVAGGFSMGANISIALAGIDHSVGRVAAIGSTPDWTRPGMRHLDASNGDLVTKEPPVLPVTGHTHS